MAVEHQIQEKVKLLPENTQYEVLDFVGSFSTDLARKTCFGRLSRSDGRCETRCAKRDRITRKITSGRPTREEARSSGTASLPPG